MMVTVAQSLDVPIKLMFPRPSADPAKTSHAMLGLGDVVLPGIVIGLALRYDLYLFYLRKQTTAPSSDLVDGANPIVVKEEYFSLSNRWSEYFWTHSLTGRPLFPSQLAAQQPHFTFPKTYFHSSLVGYIIGMLTTLGVMQIYGHAQPALLYLVPGVLGSLWATALVRGELKLMWNYSEAVEEEDDQSHENDDEAAIREKPRSSFFSLESQQRQADKMEKAINRHLKTDEDSDWDDAHVSSSSDKSDTKAADSSSSKAKSSGSGKAELDTDKKTKKITSRNKDRELFSFSIEAPWTLASPQSIGKPSDKKAEAPAIEVKDSSSKVLVFSSGTDSLKEKLNWKALERRPTDGEPVGKRLRTS
jgi:minor histocompatibility antigen H13